jgi:hypothetical protein
VKIAILSTTMLPVAVVAQAPAFYVATPAQAPARAQVVTRSTLWHARGSNYLAARGPERPAILCRVLADEIGRLSAFSADGVALDADQLARCNAKVTPEVVAVR